MNRQSIILTITLIFLIVLSGCASKTTGSTVSSPPTEAGNTAQESPSASGSEVQGKEITAPASATLSTLDGRALETVYFDYDAFTLTAEARRALERNGAWLMENFSVKVIIEGHCDERGSDEYNLALGERRAMVVKNYLTTFGVTADRLTTISFGEERPDSSGHDEIAWAKNRRAEFK